MPLNVKNNLTEGPVISRLFLLALPMVGGMFALVAFNLADTYFVGQLGTDQLAAMTFTFPVVFLVGGVAIGLGVGTSSVVSRLIGRGQMDQVRRVTTSGLLLAVLVVALLSLAGLATIRPTFRLLGAREDLLDLIEQYMTIWYVGMVFLVVPMVGNNAIRASGDTLTPSLIMMIGAGINIALDPILIWGLYGAPALGLRGAALATVFSRATTLIVSLMVLGLRKHMLCRPRLDGLWAAWKRVLYVGLPTAGVNVLGPVSMGLITRMAAGFGKQAVASIGPGTRIEALAAIPVFALLVSTVPFIGQNWGAGKIARIRQAFAAAMRFVVYWGLGCAVLIIAFARPLAERFSDDPVVVHYVTLYLRIVMIASFGGLATAVAAAVFNGLNRPLEGAAMNVLRMFALMVPLAWIGGRLYGLTGLFAGIAASHLLAAVMAITWGRLRLARLRPEDHAAAEEADIAALAPPAE